MTLIPQAAAAVLLLILTLCLQCAGVGALIEWLRSVTAKGAKSGPIRSAVLVVKKIKCGFVPTTASSDRSNLPSGIARDSDPVRWEPGERTMNGLNAIVRTEREWGDQLSFPGC
jgi:hypothetical protein